MRHRRVLITGGLGYVGTVLTPYLAKRYKVRVYDSMLFGNSIEGTPNVQFMKGDMRDADGIRQALKGCTDVIHLAGIVTDALVDLNVAKSRQINVTATRDLLLACERAGIERFILMSSSSVYGTTPEPATEEIPCKPMTAYAQSKLDQEAELFGTDWDFVRTALRSATLCGPAPRMRADTIINTFAGQAYFNGLITVWDGSQWRSNLNVKELQIIFDLILNTQAGKVQGQIFNATSGNHQALHLANMIAGAMNNRGKKVTISVDRTKTDDRHYRMSASKLTKRLGWNLTHTVEGAILDDFQFFADGGVKDFNDPIYWNTKRMASYMAD